MSRLEDLIEDELVTDVDGYVYYWPKPNGGHFSPWMLRAIADELDKINQPWQDTIDEYFANAS